jgi:phosphoribosylaminoimidazolecarboxamide formyltransferase/IMP cyclohydrolase
MPDLVPIRRALLSVSDKTDLVPFARALAARGAELVSTGGTAKALVEAGLAVTPVDRLTGFPEGLDGRVKTLHPRVHGGLLALRDDAEHERFCAEHGIKPIDLVCINLYPFERAVADPNVSLRDAIENIDVGGPAMLRAAAKNYAWVAPVCTPRRYDEIVTEMERNGGALGLELRSRLAIETFASTSGYDAAIAAFLGRRSKTAFPDVLRLSYVRVEQLRYGENPHQEAALYRDPASTGQSVVNARQLHGKELSYNNINDAASALELVKAIARFDATRPAACVVKHMSPCGAAVVEPGAGLASAVDAAIAGDPLAAYGGILATSVPIDEAAARRITAEGTFFEVIVAPEYDESALELLRKRWTGVRVLAVGSGMPSAARKLEYRSVPGGLLVQDRDVRSPSPDKWVHAAGPKPDPAVLAAGAVLEIVGRFALSNAVVIGGPTASGVRLYGLGGGQVDRLTACRIAVEKARASTGGGGGGAAGSLTGSVAVSDAFFPFSDGPRVLIDAGVKLIVQPGGSKRDDETFALCEKRGVTCVTTGVRHFRH